MGAFGWVIASLLGAPPAQNWPIWPRELILRWCGWLLVGNVCEILGWFMVVYAVGKYVGWLVGSWGHWGRASRGLVLTI